MVTSKSKPGGFVRDATVSQLRGLFFAVIVYIFSRLYHKQKEINISLAFREIPPK